jgi:hypothetical protein
MTFFLFMFNTEHTALWIADLMPNKVYCLMTLTYRYGLTFAVTIKLAISINEIQDLIRIKSLALKLLDNKCKTQ